MADATDLARLEAKVLFAGSIVALTGLHVGGNDAGLAIGGADKLVVRDPRTQQPYVPGSSLKGKMRSLLEKTDCAKARCPGFEVTKDLKLAPCACGVCRVCIVFGVAADSEKGPEPGKPYAGASRILVRDAHLANAEEVKSWPGLDYPFTEVKTEVSIDRLTSRANPRQFERVPAGARFNFEIVLNVLAGDPVEDHVKLVQKALALAADDAIGGQGSRGYGQVRIELERRVTVPIEAYADPAKLEEARARNELAQSVVYGGRIAGEASAA